MNGFNQKAYNHIFILVIYDLNFKSCLFNF